MRRVARAPVRCGAFSLLELTVVLVILALVAAVVAPSLLRGAARGTERRQLAELVGLLSLERVEAMRATAAAEVTIETVDSRLIAHGAKGDRVWDEWRTELAGIIGGRSGRAHVTFEASGRTDTRALRFVARGGSDRIWTVVFDPISGAPSLREGQEQAGP